MSGRLSKWFCTVGDPSTTTNTNTNTTTTTGREAGNEASALAAIMPLMVMMTAAANGLLCDAPRAHMHRALRELGTGDSVGRTCTLYLGRQTGAWILYIIVLSSADTQRLYPSPSAPLVPCAPCVGTLYRHLCLSARPSPPVSVSASVCVKRALGSLPARLPGRWLVQHVVWHCSWALGSDATRARLTSHMGAHACT